MTKLEKFKKTVKPRKRVSRLNQYEDEIKELLNDRYTHKQICEYLQDAYNVEVSRQYLSSYIQITIKSKNQTTQKPPNVKAPNQTSTKIDAKEAAAKLANFFEPTA